MEAATSDISVQVDSYDKEMANSILKNLGIVRLVRIFS